jgi:hypothetical protein
MKATLEAAGGDMGKVKGFIHGIGVDPFYVSFYLDEQVQAYVDACRLGNCIVHLDSTGGVMKRIPGQKTPYYYALVLSGSSLPVFELMTTCHRAS